MYLMNEVEITAQADFDNQVSIPIVKTFLDSDYSVLLDKVSECVFCFFDDYGYSEFTDVDIQEMIGEKTDYDFDGKSGIIWCGSQNVDKWLIYTENEQFIYQISKIKLVL